MEKIVNLFAKEWYRKPMSSIEKTLRFPKIVKEFLVAVAFRFVLKIVVVYLIIKLFVLGVAALVLSVLISFIWEMVFAQDWWRQKVLPIHLVNFEKIKNFELEKGVPIVQQVSIIEEVVDLSVWGLVRTFYMAGPSIIWEYVMRFIYPRKYKELLTGFVNKNTEADIALWKVANKEESLKGYLEEFGSRVIDADLAHPTLRDQPEAIRSLVQIFKQIKESPEDKLKRMRNTRLKSEKTIGRPFRWLVRIAQENVRLREDRRFYEFIADYHIRQMLLRLGKNLKLDKPEEIFNMKWKEVKGLARS